MIGYGCGHNYNDPSRPCPTCVALPTPTPEQVEEYGARILAAIDVLQPQVVDDEHLDNDRKRVESDVRAYRRNTEGREAHDYYGPDRLRYTAGRDEAWQNLRDTGALYGVTPTETS